MAKTRKSVGDDQSRTVDDSTDSANVSLDDVDHQLITLLEHDGRMSYANLGIAVGLTPGGARARVMRLQDRGVIRVVGVTSPRAVGFNSIASLQIEVDGDIDGVANRISDFDGVRYLVKGSGSFSLLVEVYAETPRALFSLINREIREVPGVSRVETFVYDSVHTHRPIFPLNGATA